MYAMCMCKFVSCIMHALDLYPDNSPPGQFPKWFYWLIVVLYGGELSYGSWSWWVIVGFYFHPVGNCPQWRAVLESHVWINVHDDNILGVNFILSTCSD